MELFVFLTNADTPKELFLMNVLYPNSKLLVYSGSRLGLPTVIFSGFAA